jgi:hypothetical protein
MLLPQFQDWSLPAHQLPLIHHLSSIAPQTRENSVWSVISARFTLRNALLRFACTRHASLLYDTQRAMQWQYYSVLW